MLYANRYADTRAHAHATRHSAQIIHFYYFIYLIYFIANGLFIRVAFLCGCFCLQQQQESIQHRNTTHTHRTMKLCIAAVLLLIAGLSSLVDRTAALSVDPGK